jgi:phosphatidylglycerophosphatase A
MLIRMILKNLATLGFIGYLPFAPGTFGTVVAVIFFALLKPPLLLHFFLLIVITAVGGVASDRAEKILSEKDSSHIVIDEFAGYALSVLSLPLTLPHLITAFLLFRFFDILKPPPIRWIEKVLPGGVGIMADDLMAGIYANVSLNVLLQVWKVPG